MKREGQEEYLAFSLERTAELLARRWHDANVWIIRPARMSQLSSEYDHLLFPGRGIPHLNALLEDAFAQTDTRFRELPLTLVAFSKGGLVLNHILAEFSSTCLFSNHSCHSSSASSSSRTSTPLLSLCSPSSLLLDWESEEAGNALPTWLEPSQRIARTKTQYRDSLLFTHRDTVVEFMERVEEMHWLDCHRFPTNDVVIDFLATYLKERWSQRATRTALKEVKKGEEGTEGEERKEGREEHESKAKLRWSVHSTPRQLNDPRRTFIRSEYDHFISRLCSASLSHCGSKEANDADEEEAPRFAPKWDKKKASEEWTAEWLPPWLRLHNHFENERRSMLNHFRVLETF
ncbi:hypothetical protein QOT17_009514 [Balamuthia mandrillaris]